MARTSPLRRTVVMLSTVALAACSDSSSGTGPPPTPPCSTPLTMRRGDVRVIAAASALECVVLASNADASEYVLITANSTSLSSDLRSYRVSGTPGGAVANVVGAPMMTPALAPNVVPTPPPRDVAQAPDVDDVGATIDARLRRASRDAIGDRRLSALADASVATRATPRSSALVTAPSVGDTLAYRVTNAASSNLCTSFDSVRGVVKAIGTRALVVQDVNAPIGGFSATDFAAIASEFDTVIYPTDAQWFGAATDINNDGRITLLFTPAINRLTPPGSLGFAGGFFYSADLLARTIPSQGYSCAASNEQEIMYLLTPDPNGLVNGNRFTVSTVMRAARGTIAHELQHMINQGVRQTVSRSAALEVDWLNEGLSHFAEEAVGRAVRGYSDFRPLTFDNVLTDLDDYDAFFKQNLSRFRFWMQRPDLASPISADALSQLAPRGAAWALVRYAVDQYSGNDARAFTRALVAGPQVDVANLEARARTTFGEILPGFLVASFGDTTSTLPLRYRFNSWVIRDVMSNINGGTFPLQISTLPADARTQSPAGSGNYFVLTRTAGAVAATVRMQSSSGALIDFPGARMYITRVK